MTTERERLLDLRLITKQEANTAARVSVSPDATKLWVVDAQNATDAYDAAKAFYAESNPGENLDAVGSIAYAEKDEDGFGCGRELFIIDPPTRPNGVQGNWTEWASKSFNS